MSDTQTIDSAAETQVADYSDVEGGSPYDEVRADGGSEGSDTEQDSSDTGGTIEPDDSGSADSSEIEALRAEIAKRDHILAELDDRMERDPVLRKMLSQGGSGANSDDDVLANLDKVLEAEFNPDAAAALRKVLGPLMKEHSEMKADLGGQRSRVAKIARDNDMAEFVSTISKNGIDPAVQKSKPFQKHLRELRSRPEFQRLESRSPTFAAEHAAAQWTAMQARRGGWRDEQSRIATAKSGKSGNAPSRGSAGAEKVIQIKRQRGGAHVERAATLRFQAERDGKPVPKIEYID